LEDVPAAQDSALREARKTAGLTQQQAAALARVDPQTISRWERGERAPSHGEREYLLDVYRRHSQGEQPRQYVPRATNERVDLGTEGGLSRQLRILAAEFEVEALKLGAEEEEMAYVRHALQSPETARMFAYGYVDRAGLSEEALRLDYEGLIEGLRLYVKMRVKRRNEAKRRT
jgi:transcriptional regulator with XRE-family HTH domain